MKNMLISLDLTVVVSLINKGIKHECMLGFS